MDARVYRINALNKIMSCSPGFSEYIANIYGLESFDGLNDNELVDIFNISTSFILDELSVMGISFTDGIEVDTEDEYIKTAIVLRQVFDKNTFNKTLMISKDVTQAVFDMFNSDNYDKALLITAIIELIFELTPLSINWGFLNEQRFTVVNNDRFIDHILTIVGTVNTQDINEVDITSILEKQEVK